MDLDAWHQVHKDLDVGLKWAMHSKDDVRLDPYLLWFLLQWPSTALSVAKDKSQFVELVKRLRVSVLVGFDPLVINKQTKDPLSAFGEVWPSHLHSTTRLPQHASPWLSVRPALASWKGLGNLVRALLDGKGGRHGVIAVEFCTQRDALDTAQWWTPSDTVKDGAQQAPLESDAEQAWRHHAVYARKVAEHTSAMRQRQRAFEPSPAAPLVSVIDDLCNFASSRLRVGGAQPLTDLWHQGSDAYTTDRLDKSKRWRSALNLDGVTVQPGSPVSVSFSGALVGRRLHAHNLSSVGDEKQAYREADYLNPPMRFSHGSAVLDLICGPSRAGAAKPASERRVPAPKVVFVQLPVPSVLDTSGGSLASHALDGIHHALESAAAGQPVIVNLSYGAHSGPHDGSSLWDTALCELLDRYNGSSEASFKTLHVVLPAGNGHRSRTHAHLHVSPSKPVRTVRWQVLPDDPTSNFLELWFPHGVEAGISVTAPNGRLTKLSGHGVGEIKDTNARLLYPRRCPQSSHSTMALLALGPSTLRIPPIEFQMLPSSQTPSIESRIVTLTQDGSIDNVAKSPKVAFEACPHGVWTIEVSQGSSEASRDFMFHAWVMRGDAAPNRRQARHGNSGRQSYLLGCDGEQIDPQFTINGIACLEHERLWVVGAMRRQDNSLAVYSASGPNRCSGHPDQQSWRTMGPDVVVSADESLNLRGLLVGGVLSGARGRVSGTSIAAAVFTRHLYEHLEAGRPACTAGFGPPASPSRVSPTGHPCVQDAPLATRGESNRIEL